MSYDDIEIFITIEACSAQVVYHLCNSWKHDCLLTQKVFKWSDTWAILNFFVSWIISTILVVTLKNLTIYSPHRNPPPHRPLSCERLYICRSTRLVLDPCIGSHLVKLENSCSNTFRHLVLLDTPRGQTESGIYFNTVFSSKRIILIGSDIIYRECVGSHFTVFKHVCFDSNIFLR